MKQYKLKGCPRCLKGDLALEKNAFDQQWERVCLQCGYREDVKKTDPLPLLRGGHR